MHDRGEKTALATNGARGYQRPPSRSRFICVYHLAAQPAREDALPDPRSPNAISNLAAEFYVKIIKRLKGIKT
ncbi:MAG: hypothetical protein AB1453_01240 [Chloroflexota bacterium]